MQPFERLEGALARRFAGTGLGLPLARALLGLHGAALTIVSEPGVGNTASVVFGRERYWVPVRQSVREDLAQEQLGAL